MKKTLMLIFVPFILVGTTSCNLNNSNQVGRYTFQRIQPNDLSSYLVFDTKEGIIYIGAYMEDGFYLHSTNAITGEKKSIVKPETKSK